MNLKDDRLALRFANFSRALEQLERACAQGRYTELERAGLIQMFEFTLELAWKTLKAWLEGEGLPARTPREAIRQAMAAGLLDERITETLLEALSQRNVLVQTYTERLAREAEKRIREHYCPVFGEVRQRLQGHMA